MLRNIVLTTGANAAIVVINIITGVLLARLLGPSLRGELAAAQAFPSMVSSIAMLGLPQAVTFWVSREPERSRQTTAAALSLFGPLIAVAVLVVYVSAPYALAAQSPEVIRGARIYSLIAVGFSFGSLYMWVLQGLKRFRYWNLLRLLPCVLWLLALVVAHVSGHLTVTFLVAAALLFPLPSWIVLNVLLWKRLSGAAKPTPSRAHDLVKYGLPVTLASIPQTLNLRLDQILMAAMLGPDVLGQYAVGVTWSGASGFLLGAVGSVVFPSLAGTGQALEKQRIAGIIMRLSIVLALAVVVLQGAITSVVVPLLFGSAFEAAVPSATVLVFAGGLSGLNALWKDILNGAGFPRLPMYAEIIGLATTALLLGLLLRPYQLMGAAVASILSYATTLGYLGVAIHGRIQLSFRQMLVPSRGDFRLLQSALERAMRSVNRTVS